MTTTDEDKLTIHHRLSMINRDLGAIAKEGINAQQGYKFRGIDSVYNVLHPLFAKWGVTCIPVKCEWKTEERTTAKGALQVHSKVIMTWALTGPLGDSVSMTVPGEALDTSDKATNKAMSAAHKYALVQMFTIPFDDLAESDKETPELGKKKTDPSVADVAKETIALEEATVYLDKIHAATTAGELAKLAKLIKDAGLPEKFNTSLRAEYARQKEKLAQADKPVHTFVEDLGDQDAAS